MEAQERGVDKDIERGRRIRELREAANLTQEQFADAVEVTLRAAQEWEYGGGMSHDSIRKLAKLFKVDTEFIRIGPEAEPTESQLSRLESKIDELLSRTENQ